MSQNNRLSSIIDLVNKESELPHGSVLVRIDSRTGEVLDGGLANFLRKVTLVATRLDEATDVLEGTLNIRNFASNERASVAYRMRLSIPSEPKHARNLAAQTLFGPAVTTTPYDYIERLVEKHVSRWIEQQSRQRPLPVHELVLNHGSQLSAEISESLFQEAGLNTQIKFPIKTTDVRERLELDFSTSVRLSDYPSRAYPLNVYLVLQRNGQAPTHNEPRDTAAWQATVAPLIQQATQEHVQLYHYFYRREELNNFYRECLKNDLARYGRSVASLQVTAKEPPPVPEKEHVSVSVPWKSASGQAVNFQVDAVVNVTPEGLSKFQNARDGRGTSAVTFGPRAFIDWLKSAVERELPQALFRHDFTDVAKFSEEALATLLKPRLDEAAREIGVGIETFVAKPSISAAKYLGRNETIVPPTEYDTSEAGRSVKFEISVSWKVPDLATVKHFLTPVDTLTQAVSETIRKAAGRAVRQLNPGFYATQFDRGIDDRGIPYDPLKDLQNANPVEPLQQRYAADIIRTEITRSLSEYFGIVAESIHFRQDDDALKQARSQIDRLQHFEYVKQIKFRFPDGSIRDCDLKAKWRVAGLSPEYPWKATERPIDEDWVALMKDSLNEWSLQVFDMIEQAEEPINIQTQGILHQVRERFGPGVSKEIEWVYGVTIELMYLRGEDMESHRGLLGQTAAEGKRAAILAASRMNQRQIASTEQQQNNLLTAQELHGVDMESGMIDQRGTAARTQRAEELERQGQSAVGGPSDRAQLQSRETNGTTKTDAIEDTRSSSDTSDL